MDINCTVLALDVLSDHQSWSNLFLTNSFAKKNLTRIVDEYELKALSHLGWID